jgi:tight adherence protein C
METLHTLLSIRWEVAAASVGAMVSVIALLAGVRAMFFSRPSEVVERLERTVGRADTSDRFDREVAPGRTLARVLQPLSWIVRPTKAAELSRLRGKLIQAGYRGNYSLEIFLGTKIVFAAVLTVGFLQLNAHVANRIQFPFDMVITVWTCIVAFFLPNFWLNAKVKERQTAIERGLPDALDLLVTCVEAGLGLDAALARVSDEIGLASPILGDELNVTFLEVQAGIARPDAFRRLAERTGVEDLRALSAMLIQTDMFGTSVARALRVHSEGMRTKRMQRAEEKAAMVGVKMTIPLILCILPSLVAVLLGPAAVSIAEVFFGTDGGGGRL